MDSHKLYTLSVFTENRIGLLNQITIVFTRRNQNIESITASETEIKGIYRYTIIIKATAEQVRKIVGQIDKLTEVIKAFSHEEHEVVYQELGLYKVKIAFEGTALKKIIRKNHARILSLCPDFMVLEKTGHSEELLALFHELEPYGILEYACSGHVAVTKPMRALSDYLCDLN